jgi:hypothetical protein
MYVCSVRYPCSILNEICTAHMCCFSCMSNSMCQGRNLFVFLFLMQRALLKIRKIQKENLSIVIILCLSLVGNLDILRWYEGIFVGIFIFTKLVCQACSDAAY